MAGPRKVARGGDGEDLLRRRITYTVKKQLARRMWLLRKLERTRPLIRGMVEESGRCREDADLEPLSGGLSLLDSCASHVPMPPIQSRVLLSTWFGKATLNIDKFSLT